jgi:hypothetical protein
MFALAVLIGIYSYGIFGLGILHLLTKSNILGFTFSWLLITGAYLLSHLKLRSIITNFSSSVSSLTTGKKILLGILTAQILVNLLGVFGPEIGFDALWYHLGLPKIWLLRHEIAYLPGPTFRYSVMPKLTETLYTAALAFSGVSLAKLIHFTFGLLSVIVTYQLSRKFLSVPFSLLACVIFSANLVFGWESSSAYVDLSRTFFEVLALRLFSEKKYTSSAVTLGLAAAVKIISLISLPLFLLLLRFDQVKPGVYLKYIFYTLLIPLPWLTLAFTATGNPFYPLLSSVMEPAYFSLNPRDLWILFTSGPDPISPLYLITAPLIFSVKFTKQGRGVRKIFLYAGIALLLWFIFPHPGGSRFLLPYLPVFSLLAAWIISLQKDKFIRNFLLVLALTLSLTTVLYRLTANWKFLPVITNRQSRADFLLRHLNFRFGDYYDAGNVLASAVTADKTLLVAGINNLFYLPDGLNFTHLSELADLKAISQYDYLLIRQPDAGFTPRKDWILLNRNLLTNTQLYRHN